ncbi:MAG: hypothetical protein WA081_23010 [Desulfosalsimonadaceae bacterium]
MDIVDEDRLAQYQEAFPVDPDRKTDPLILKTFVNCGVPLPEHEIEVRDSNGRVLPERHCGTLFIRLSSITIRYLMDIEKTLKDLSDDSLLDTGDTAYRISDKIVITGRQKDIIIINGRTSGPRTWSAWPRPILTQPV